MTAELSQLGLGTASFSRRLGATAALAAMHAAWDEGITHFDTAPMYGFGYAETVMSRFLAGRRDQLTLTTKIGILPPPAAAVRVVPGRLLRGPLGPRQDFRLRVVRSSFERSLKNLGTDRVDFLLLHECSPGQVGDELLTFLDDCVQSGTALAIGTATNPPATKEVHERHQPFPAVAQLPWEPGGRHYRCSRTITHSCLRLALGATRDRPGTVERWSRELGVDCTRADVVAGLALALAVQDSRGGSTLFGTRSPEHIRANCAFAGDFAQDAAILNRFRELLTGALDGGADAQ